MQTASKAIEERVVNLLRQVLALDPALRLGRDTALLGALPELDSLSLVGLLTALESEFGLRIEDDEVSAELFHSVATLAEFVATKTAPGGDPACDRSS
ncbi:MAG: acyl carrier protein [Gammaproteobacteria bacterium]